MPFKLPETEWQFEHLPAPLKEHGHPGLGVADNDVWHSSNPAPCGLDRRMKKRGYIRNLLLGEVWERGHPAIGAAAL